MIGEDVEAAIKDWIRVIFDASDDVSSKDDSPIYLSAMGNWKDACW